MNFNKLRIIFYLPLTVFLFCVKSAMPMTTTSVIKAEQIKLIRQTLLTRLVKKQKNIIITLIPTPDTTVERQPSGDIYLGYNQYELIGTNSGHLMFVNNQQKSFEKIKAHRDAISSITANGDIVATGSCTCKEIHRWNISTFKIHDKISCQAPIIFMHTIKNHLFTVDIQGRITLIDWETGTPICHMETEISQPILNTVINTKDGFIIIMAPKTKALVKIDLLVGLDMLIYSLKEEQLTQIIQIITLDASSQDYTKIISDANLPDQIKELLNMK